VCSPGKFGSGCFTRSAYLCLLLVWKRLLFLAGWKELHTAKVDDDVRQGFNSLVILRPWSIWKDQNIVFFMALTLLLRNLSCLLDRNYTFRVCLVGLWLWKKLLWAVSCGKSCCRLCAVKKLKIVWWKSLKVVKISSIYVFTVPSKSH
jgi:hypothetical protein